VRGNRKLYLIGFESTVLQESHLPGFLFEIGWRLRPELLASNLASQRVPVLSGLVQDILDNARIDIAFGELGPDSYGTLALVDPGLDENLDKALVALQALCREILNSLDRNVTVESSFLEFARELAAAMLASREQVHRLLAGFDRAGETFLVVQLRFLRNGLLIVGCRRIDGIRQ